MATYQNLRSVTIDGRTVTLDEAVESIQHDGTGYTVEFKPARYGTLEEAIEAGGLIEEPEQ